jgi:hypothetical protein
MAPDAETDAGYEAFPSPQWVTAGPGSTFFTRDMGGHLAAVLDRNC